MTSQESNPTAPVRELFLHNGFRRRKAKDSDRYNGEFDVNHPRHLTSLPASDGRERRVLPIYRGPHFPQDANIDAYDHTSRARLGMAAKEIVVGTLFIAKETIKTTLVSFLKKK